jgi:anti-sigma regulatory factor (Ser/Thr protein kinase)
MEVIEHARLRVGDSSSVGHARRMAAELGGSLRLGEKELGRLAVVVTEIGTNLVKHAGEGEILLRSLVRGDNRGVGVLALDRGPGIGSLAEALRDGFSSRGSPGTGLGAISRMASQFDVYSRPEGGTVVWAAVWTALREGRLLVGGINVPHPAEQVSGDLWVLHEAGERISILVADGLGHGIHASEAAGAAGAVFRRHPGEAPVPLLERIHAALRSTRGAAVGIAQLDLTRSLLRFAGLGNIAGTIVADGATRSVVSQHGTAGHDARRIQEFSYEWPSGGLFILHSDGLVSNWSLEDHPGLERKHPMLVAGVLYRDYARGHDDTSVVAVRVAA